MTDSFDLKKSELVMLTVTVVRIFSELQSKRTVVISTGQNVVLIFMKAN